jgi:hypothetical protein
MLDPSDTFLQMAGPPLSLKRFLKKLKTSFPPRPALSSSCALGPMVKRQRAMAADSPPPVPAARSPRVGLLYDERMCAHAAADGEDYPENPERLRAIWCKLDAEGITSRYGASTGSPAPPSQVQKSVVLVLGIERRRVG